MNARGLSPAATKTYRWLLLRYRGWLLNHHSGSFESIGTLIARRKVESFLKALTEESVSAQTRASIAGALKRFSTWLSNKRKLKTDILATVEVPRSVRQRLPRSLPSNLRHSCATHLLDGGAGLRSIQRFLGPSRLDTTSIDTHVSNNQLSEIHAKCHPHGDLAGSTPPPPDSFGNC